MARSDRENLGSVSKFLDFRGDKRAKRRVTTKNVPKVGSFILYNEVERDHGIGCPARQRRGVGKVLSYTGACMVVEIYLTSTYVIRESWLVNDIRLGFLRWRELKDFIFVNKVYKYSELDIDCPHEDIVKLFVDNLAKN